MTDLPAGTHGRHVATSSDAPDAVEVVRSEERLRPAVERVPVRVARLEKFIVTERRTITVDVRHEEVRLVYDDLPPGVDTSGLPSTTGPLPAVVLSEERVEVRKVVVPVERARLVVDRVTEQQEVTGVVRAERIAVEDGSPIRDA